MITFVYLIFLCLVAQDTLSVPCGARLESVHLLGCMYCVLRKTVPRKMTVSRPPADSTVVPPETTAVYTGVCVVIFPCSWAAVRL